MILFYITKTFAPGGADENVYLNAAILNPHCCSQPRAAQVELLRRKENIKRTAEPQCHPAPPLLSYRAMESIFAAVFDKVVPMLNARWINLENEVGLPRHVKYGTLEKVAVFANAEAQPYWRLESSEP